MKSNEHFDYIILGSGAAGLSLAHRMANDDFFDDVSIAIIDQNVKNKNDRTWCFWETEKGYFDSIVKKSWDEVNFYSNTLQKRQAIRPYKYKMISGLDFYNHTISFINKSDNIRFIQGKVIDTKEHSNKVEVITESGSYYSDQIFKSYPTTPEIDPDAHLYVDQHFKGFFIETQEPTFDPSCATFMDFRIDQKGDTRFLYVLPESDTRALVEVALFSNDLLEQHDYDQILTDYMRDYLEINDYKVLDEEFGIIPMTAYAFKNHNTNRIFHIGTGGGIVKASSGFAFSRIQKHSDQLLQCIKNNKPLEKSYQGLHGRHLFYDKILLHAMLRNGVSGDEIFSSLFSKMPASHIFKFLDQETSFLEEIDIFRGPPMVPFVKSFFAVLGR